MACAGVVFAAASLASLLAVASAEFYDTFTGRQISPAKYQEYDRLNLVPYCAIEVQPCDANEPRRLDYSCNNLYYPSRGTTMTPYRRMLPPMFDANSNHRPSSSGTPLPNARSVRTAVMSDGRKESLTYTQLVPNSAVYITGDITSVHDTVNYVAVTTTCCASGESDPRCMPIRVPDDDVHLRYSNVRCLNLTKVITYQTLGCAPNTLPPERINTSPPMLEMSILYGNDERSARRGREGSGGRLREETQNGVVYPPSGSQFCLQNQRPAEDRCHGTPSPATNGLLGINLLSIWFWRNHNAVARRLEALNPCWDDERLFFEAREVNIAMMNQIWYYELMPTVMGFDYLLKSKAIFDTSGHVDDYDPKLEPRVSIEYVIGTRWFHSMQEGRAKMYDNKGRLLNELKAVEMTLRTGLLPNNRTLEGLTQGSFRQPAAESDHLIDPDMGERVLGGLQAVSDVASSDIMKSREAGLPPYNHYRKLCGLPVAKDFDDLRGWMYQEQIEGLKLTYEDVDDIDFMVGIMAERRMRGAVVGPTLACVMADQLVWWRRADRFWYENRQHPGAFTEDQLREIRETTLARLICDNADEVDQIQPFAYFVARPDNQPTDCKNLRAPRLDPWRDEQCQINMNNKLQLQNNQNNINNKPQILDVQTQGWNQQILNNQISGGGNMNPAGGINMQTIGWNQQTLNKQPNAQNQLNNKPIPATNAGNTPNVQNSGNKVLTKAVPSTNANWAPNAWNGGAWTGNLNSMDVQNAIGNWGPSYNQNARWGPGFVTTQSPNNNNIGNNQGNGQTNNSGNQGATNNNSGNQGAMNNNAGNQAITNINSGNQVANNNNPGNQGATNNNQGAINNNSGNQGATNNNAGNQAITNINSGNQVANNNNPGNQGATNNNSGNQGATNNNAGNQAITNINSGNQVANNNNPGNQGATNNNSGNQGATNNNAGNQAITNINSGNQVANNNNPGNQRATNNNSGNQGATNNDAGNQAITNINSGNQVANNNNPGNQGATNNNSGNQGATNNNAGNQAITNINSGNQVANNNNPGNQGATNNNDGNQGASNNNQGLTNNANSLQANNNSPNSLPAVVNGPLGSMPSGGNWPSNVPFGLIWPNNIPPNANWPNNMPPSANWPNNMPPNGNWPNGITPNANWVNNMPPNVNWPNNMPPNGNWPNGMTPNANWVNNMPPNANWQNAMPPNAIWPDNLPPNPNWLNNMPPNPNWPNMATGANGPNNIPANGPNNVSGNQGAINNNSGNQGAANNNSDNQIITNINSGNQVANNNNPSNQGTTNNNQGATNKNPGNQGAANNNSGNQGAANNNAGNQAITNINSGNQVANNNNLSNQGATGNGPNNIPAVGNGPNSVPNGPTSMTPGTGTNNPSTPPTNVMPIKKP